MHKLIIVFCIILLPLKMIAAALGQLQPSLLSAADFVVKVPPGKLTMFNLGLGRLTEEGAFKAVLVPRADTERFFEDQKRKDMILVEYQVLSLEGKELEDEVDRTKKFFEKFGYKRIVLISPINQGTTILLDTSGQYPPGYFDWHDGRPAFVPQEVNRTSHQKHGEVNRTSQPKHGDHVDRASQPKHGEDQRAKSE